jgi:hypothetical protein
MAVRSLASRSPPRFTPGTQFCKAQSLVRLEGFGILKKCNYLIGSRTRDLSACIIVPQPLRFLVSQLLNLHETNFFNKSNKL